MEKRLFTVDELSSYIAMPKATIYTWVSMRRFPPLSVVKLGRTLRFDKASIDCWIADRTQPA